MNQSTTTSSIKPTRPANGSPEGGRAKTLFSVVGGRRPHRVCPPSTIAISTGGAFRATGASPGIATSLATVTEGTREHWLSESNGLKPMLPCVHGGLVEVSDLSRGPKAAFPRASKIKLFVVNSKGN